MQRYNLPNKLHISMTALQSFLEQMENGYSKYKNPYHNLIHAADVLQTTYQIVYNSGLMNWLTDHDLFAMFIAAIVHDFEHTGTSNNFHIQSSVEKAKALALILHCADISHPGKPWDIHHTWTQSLMEEFFKQGEKEKDLGLPCSPLCDRENTLIAESQIGFIQYIVEPSFVVMGDMLDKVLKSLVVSDSELLSPSIPSRSLVSSPVPSGESSAESNAHPEEQNGHEKKLPLSMTTPISRPTTVRRPWADYLKSNRDRWVKEAEEERRRKELKVIEEEP
ncbi:unnamed protein product [Rotaria socialis]|uniref:PDEase domain-containing protein n=1 Tax=Rotaria socialis TaxID=392032 RepID=A0A820Y4L5_9BILA|nr:unnamed protein product [Rotaria socialis]